MPIDDQEVKAALTALSGARDSLLATAGVTAVGVGLKQSGGRTTDTVAIVVYVAEKKKSPASAVPPAIDGVPTDVQQREFAFTPIDQHARHDPMHGGLAITPIEHPGMYGSIGCFIYTPGRRAEPQFPAIPAGDYLLTNHHVVKYASPPYGAERRIIQPDAADGNVPGNYVCGSFVAGVLDAANDCALVRVTGRGFRNEIRDEGGHPVQLAGIGTARLGDDLVKYGATTGYTTGRVTTVGYSFVGDGSAIHDALYVQNVAGTAWVDGGDSGSVAVRAADRVVVGLNFRADTTTPVAGGFSGGLAYNVFDQMANFADAGGQPQLRLS